MHCDSSCSRNIAHLFPVSRKQLTTSYPSCIIKFLLCSPSPNGQTLQPSLHIVCQILPCSLSCCVNLLWVEWWLMSSLIKMRTLFQVFLWLWGGRYQKGKWWVLWGGHVPLKFNGNKCTRKRWKNIFGRGFGGRSVLGLSKDIPKGQKVNFKWAWLWISLWSQTWDSIIMIGPSITKHGGICSVLSVWVPGLVALSTEQRGLCQCP